MWATHLLWKTCWHFIHQSSWYFSSASTFIWAGLMLFFLLIPKSCFGLAICISSLKVKMKCLLENKKITLQFFGINKQELENEQLNYFLFIYKNTFFKAYLCKHNFRRTILTTLANQQNLSIFLTFWIDLFSFLRLRIYFWSK